MPPRIPAVTIVALVLAACSQPVDPHARSATDPSQTGLLVLANGPTQSGIVTRSEVGFAVAVADADADLFALHSSFGNFFGLCGPFEFVPWEAHTVQRDPSSGFGNPDGDPVITLLKAEEHSIEVFRLSSLIGFPCDWDLVATGTGKIVVHNNDAFSFLRGELVRAAAFGWTANGIVETPEGETLRYHATQKIVQTPSGRIHEIGKIQLR